MRINEIFQSISGEAARAGYPVVFVRTYGCNLRCSYCDTMYALEGGEYTEMTPLQILEKCKSYNIKRVVLTGGEPLLQQDMPELVDLLCNNGFEIEIETNGAVDLNAFHDKLTTKDTQFLSYTMDFKTESSLMSDKMITSNLSFLGTQDVIKFVVGSIEDLQQAFAVWNDFNIEAQVFVSPVFGKIEPKDIVSFVLDNKLWNWRVQLQLHKIIYPVDMRGV